MGSHGAVTRCPAAEESSQRASGRACAGLVEIEGPGSPDADQRHSREYDGGGAEGTPRPLRGYSYRNATVGEIRVARSAGTDAASRITNVIPSGVIANVSASVTSTPNSMILNKRVRARAPQI